MKFKDAKKLIDKAIIEKDKDDIFKIYLADRPRMEKIISFNDYLLKLGYTKHIQVNLDKRDDDEISRELEEVNKLFQAQKEGVSDGTV